MRVSAKRQIQSGGKPRALHNLAEVKSGFELANRIGSAFDSRFGVGNERRELFHFFREPADFWIAMVPAARLRNAIAAEEGPVLRTPVIKPKTILGADFLAQLLKRRMRPDAILISDAGQISEI